MTQHTYYTALGHFQCKRDPGGQRYASVLMAGKESVLDLQEATLWACLNWRIADQQQAQQHYDALEAELQLVPRRTFDDCLNRLLVRGLVAAGTGATEGGALYDLLSPLLITPLIMTLPLRLALCWKLLLQGCDDPAAAAHLLRRDRRSDPERQVMALSRQAILSTAELIQCVEHGVHDVSTDEKLMDALYGDPEITSDNLVFSMQAAKSSRPVIEAVANLYLRRQIVLERV